MVLNFVSISGVSEKWQLNEIKKITISHGIKFPVVIGYQMSNKSINEGTRNPRQPFFSDLAELEKLTRSYGFISALHYYTKDNQTIIEDLERVRQSGIEPELLQFNTLPPKNEILREAKNLGFKNIFKVAVSNKAAGGYKVWKGDEVEDVSSGNVDALVAQVYERRNFLDYVLFDPSHGTSSELDLNEASLAIRFGKKIIKNQEFESLGLIYAGGIKPSNVKKVAKTLDLSFPGRASIDSEGGLRTENNLDIGLVRDYLIGYRDRYC